MVEALCELLPLAVAQLRLVFQAHGEVDFTAVAWGAIEALGTPEEPTDLALSLDYRIRHLLVDEFQDTSQSQFELLEKLTAGWEAGDGRTLFVVGDPMQSIYRFRQAEVGLYLRARHEGIGAIRLVPLDLKVNFRSQAGIVDWVNAAFAQVLPPREDIGAGAVRYAASVAQHPALPGPAVTVHAFPEPDRVAEAERVLTLARQALGADAQKTVAVLVRSRSHLFDIAPRLKQAGLRFRAVEIEALGHRPVVQDLLALTRALVHPADRIAWLAILRAPLVRAHARRSGGAGRRREGYHGLAAADRRGTPRAPERRWPGATGAHPAGAGGVPGEPPAVFPAALRRGRVAGARRAGLRHRAHRS